MWCTVRLRYATAKSLQSCPTLCDPIEGSLPGSPVPGILQARTVEWVAISLSNAWNWKVKVKSLSLVRLLATSCTAAYQAPPSMGFSSQEHWSGLPLPSPTNDSQFSVKKKKRHNHFCEAITHFMVKFSFSFLWFQCHYHYLSFPLTPFLSN